MAAPNRSETFGRLLKAGIASIANCEGKTAPLVEDDLGAQIGVAGKSVQRYKAGYLPPDPRTVQILADACVRRGMMGREWLEALLHHARYPFADRLLDQLRPLGPARPRPPRVYENLPAPTYSQFVMREQAFAEVADGLGKRTAAVLVVGMGGNGKTSLAREVAAACLRDDGVAPRFDAAVWVSDKDRPGTTNLSTVLDEIARTLDYPGFTQFEHDEKRREVEQLLRRQRVLLVVDNFETITDGGLLAWLLRLPEPSKALVTSREYRREWRSSWPVELRGMGEGEIRTLIDHRLRQLRIERLVGSLDQMELLIVATGGNPKAIEIALGLVKHERRPLHQVVDDLYAARGELFDDLFARAWALLDEAARRVLLVATFFPTSASGEALGASADVQGFAFDRAVERLTDLALLDAQQADLDSAPRYTLHPLVRAFARVRLAGKPEIERVARDRWIEYLVSRLDLPANAGDVTQKAIMEEHSDAIQSFLRWSYEEQNWRQYLRLYLATHPLLNIAPLHSARIDYPCWAAAAAQALGEHEVHIRSLLQVARLYVYYRERAMAQAAYDQAASLTQIVLLDAAARLRVEKRLGTTKVLILIYTEQIAAAHQLASDLLPHAQTPYHAAELRYYGALCLHKLGYDDQAQATLSELVELPEEDIEPMFLCRVCTTLAEIYLGDGRYMAAAPIVERNVAVAAQMRDRYQIARARMNQARLFQRRGDTAAAASAFTDSIDLFERMGMRAELSTARAELAGLEASGPL